MKIDLTKIEGLIRGAEKSIGRCPACADKGGDRKQVHLVIYPDGSFGCVAHQDDKEHNRRILSLVGIRGGKRTSTGGQREGAFLGGGLSFSRPCYPKLDAAGKAPLKHSCVFSYSGKAEVREGEG